MLNREFNDGDLVPGTSYRVLSLLGAGGMGTVYEVEHTELGKRFVLKALIRELARRQDLVERLRNEWRALGRLEHPNIVSVTDAGTTSTGVPYYVMERLEGETLAARLRRVRRLPVPQALELCAAIVEGLGAAHAIGIVHRDVKPPNVFLTNGERPKLLDFGVAKIADSANVVTGRGVAVGTPRFMSPEQARGERVDGRSDLYACGLLLFEMVAGVGPFDDARDANELLLAHASREAPRLGSLVMGVLPEVDELCSALLSKDPRRRPGNARDVSIAMRALAEDYGRRISSTSLTPFANYSEITREQPLASPAQDDTTRPEGVVSRETATLRGDELTRTSVDSGTDPAVATPAAARIENLPSTTLADPLSDQLTEVPPLPARSPSSAAVLSAVTVRLGTVDPEVLSVETRTHAPPSTVETPSSLRPVVPASKPLRERQRRRRGFTTAVVAALALLASATVAWQALLQVSAAEAHPPDPAVVSDSVTAAQAPSAGVPATLDREAPRVGSPPAPSSIPQENTDVPRSQPAKSASATPPSAPRAVRKGPPRARATPPAGLPASGL